VTRLAAGLHATGGAGPGLFRFGAAVLRMAISDQPFKAPMQEVLPPAKPWSSLGLMPEVQSAVEGLGFETPTQIQSKAIPQVMGGGNVLLAAATGSGKTIAYLLPVISQLKAQEVDGAERHNSRPRALVLVPTRELARQVLEVTKSLSHRAKISSCAVLGGEDYGKQKRALSGAVDLVVASPGRLLKHRDAGAVHLSKVTHVIIDEVDTMLTQGFGADIKQLLKTLTSGGGDRNVQFILVSATITSALRKLLDEGDITNTRMIETRDLHRPLPTMRHTMLESKGRDKVSMLIDVLRQNDLSSPLAGGPADSSSPSTARGTLIFCNTVQSCRAVEHSLREAGIASFAYHGEIPSSDRAINLSAFKEGRVPFLVCTDIAARGLDMPDVGHVVMFDFPLNPIDYLHRSGRTARNGAAGRVTSILSKRDVVLAAAIEQAVRSGTPLDKLTARKTDYEKGGKLAPLMGRQGRERPKGNKHQRAPGISRTRSQQNSSDRAGNRGRVMSKGGR
jgi:superfamily II DNA/RNA helicase